MRRLYAVCALVVVGILLNGCILSPKQDLISVNVYVGESQTFGITIFPNDSNIEWELNGETVQGETGKYFTYTPTIDDVTESDTPQILKVFASSDTRTWEINVLPPIYGDITDPAQAQDVLYAAYAGIGYGDQEVTTDDAFLYRVMVADLNDSIEAMVINTFFMADLDALTQFTSSSGGTVTYTDANGNTFSLYLNISLLRNTYSGKLSVDFSDNGFQSTVGNFIFYGTPGEYDFTVDISGGIELVLTQFAINMFSINSVKIVAAETLVTSYTSPSVEVNYNNWTISYSVQYGDNPSNTKLAPNVEYIAAAPSYDDTIDNRNYTYGGSFSVNGDVYEFDDGFRYQQVDNGDETTNIIISGNLSVPDIDGVIQVDTADTVRGTTGIWTSGNMTLTGFDTSTNLQTTYAIAFSDGNASGEPEAWAVTDWQNALAPY